MLPEENAVDTAHPMLWWAARFDSPNLAGMAAPGADFPFVHLAQLGLDVIVSLNGPPGYDPSPLSSRAWTLQDLFGGPPADPKAELSAVADAVAGVRSLRAGGHGVVVHCGAGIGRTGLVIGAVLVSEGAPIEDTCAWLDAVQRRRGARGWPESPWQREALATFAVPGLTQARVNQQAQLSRRHVS